MFDDRTFDDRAKMIAKQLYIQNCFRWLEIAKERNLISDDNYDEELFKARKMLGILS